MQVLPDAILLYCLRAFVCREALNKTVTHQGSRPHLCPTPLIVCLSFAAFYDVCFLAGCYLIGGKDEKLRSIYEFINLICVLRRTYEFMNDRRS